MPITASVMVDRNPAAWTPPKDCPPETARTVKETFDRINRAFQQVAVKVDGQPDGSGGGGGNGGGGLFARKVTKLVHYLGANEFPYTTLDNTYNWRQGPILYEIRSDYGYPVPLYYPDFINVPMPDASIAWIYPAVVPASYPYILQGGPNLWSLRITSAGALEIGFDNTGTPHTSQYALITVSAPTAINNGAPVIELGNGS